MHLSGLTRPRSLLYLASIDFPHVKARAIQIVNTCHALARAGCRVTMVVGRRESGPPADHLARYGLTPHPGLGIVGLPAVRLPRWSPAWLHRWYTRAWNWSYLAGVLVLLPFLLRGGPDAVLARDYRLAWLLIKLRRWHRRRLVFEVHGLPSVELLERVGRAGRRQRKEVERLRDLEQAVFDGAWLLLTITDCLRARLIQDYAVTPDRVCTVPDAGRGPGPLEAGERPGQSPGSSGRARLIYVGQLYPWKGVDQALRALSGVPEAELTIVGGLPDDPQRQRLERLAQELGVAERLRFTGPRSYQEVPALLAEADVALLPLADGVVARCFTSPLKLFDYLAAGLPIVAVDVPAIREVLHHEQNGLLVKIDDPDVMALAIRRLLDEPELAARLGQQARQDALEYTWDRRAERILAALDRAESPDLSPVGLRLASGPPPR